MTPTEARLDKTNLNQTPVNYARYLLVGGLVAPVVYVVATVIGGLIRPGYSHLAEPISELTAAGAPNKALLDPLYALYNLLIVVFGLGLFLAISHALPARAGRLGRLGAAFVILSGLFGLTFYFFPQDPGGPPVTLTGTVHVVLAGVAALAFLLAILVLALAARNTSPLRAYAIFSFAALAVIVTSGAVTPVALSSGWDSHLGLIQRTNIGAIMIWVFVTAWTLFSLVPRFGDRS